MYLIERMRYWEMSFDKVRTLGWSVGYFKFFHIEQGWMWSADASKDGRRIVVQAEILDVAMFELEKQCTPLSLN